MTLSIANRKYPTKLALYEFALKELDTIMEFTHLRGLENPDLLERYPEFKTFNKFFADSESSMGDRYRMSITRLLGKIKKEFLCLPKSKLTRKIYTLLGDFEDIRKYCAELRVLINQEIREIPFTAIEE
jgi:hypothetical protein